MLIFAHQALAPDLALRLASLRFLEDDRFLLGIVDTAGSKPGHAGGFFEIWHVEVKPDPRCLTGRSITPLECLIHLRFEGPLDRAAEWVTTRLQEQLPNALD